MSRAARLQSWLPQRTLGRLIYKLARSRRDWLKQRLIDGFMRLYPIDLSEAENPNPADYETFNAFFTRALKPGARPLEGDDRTLVSPVDGRLTEFGTLDADRLLQAKGMSYRLADLLDADAGSLDAFMGGHFMTIYLAPHDYHRVHAPIGGRLLRSRYIDGRRFCVNEATARTIERLFCRNERLALGFEGEAGPWALVMVGALNVSSLSTVVHGEIASGPSRDLAHDDPARFARAAEIGSFNLGSTVVLVFAKGTVDWLDTLTPGRPIRLGEAIGRLRVPG
jgi:phosphatidylserine decarboxylase